MARTVNRNQTLEEFRGNYNKLANDVGTISGLSGNINNGNNLVDAINELENKTFYFDNFTFTATASQTTFNSSHETDSKTVKIRAGRFQVFKNGDHLNEGNDFTVSAPSAGISNSITLNSGATVGDIINIYTFTGSAVGDGGGVGGATGQFTETAANTIYNINSNGVILNGDSSSRTTELQSGFTVQLAGATYGEENLTLASGKTLSAPTITDGTATITGGAGTGFSSITSTAFVGALTGNVTGNVSGSAGTVTAINTHSAAGLSDINYTTTPSNGQILQWDNANGYWEPADKDNSDNVAEGSTNLYFTDARVSTRVDTILNHSNHTNLTVSKTGDELRFTAAATYGDSDVQSYLSGGAGLAMSGSGSFSVNTSNGVKIDGDDVELDYEIVSSAPGSVGSTSTGHLWFVV